MTTKTNPTPESNKLPPCDHDECPPTRCLKEQPNHLCFNDGSHSMTRHCLAAITLVERGQWTIERMKQWLTACLENDPKFLEEAIKEIHDKSVLKQD